MPQETVGFVNLEWTCKCCGSKNPGTTKICSSCGNVMSETDKFELPAQQELIKDEAVIAKAERGPDVTCKYCGARNVADAKTCSQCSADLTEASELLKYALGSRWKLKVNALGGVVSAEPAQ